MGEKLPAENGDNLRNYVNDLTEHMSLGEKVAFLIRNNTVMVINEQATCRNQAGLEPRVKGTTAIAAEGEHNESGRNPLSILIGK